MSDSAATAPDWPACRHRGAILPILPPSTRPRCECNHVRVRGGKQKPPVVVHLQHCRECPYSLWSPDVAIREMQARGRLELLPRVAICDACPVRDGNVCSPANTCGLTAKIARPAFGCPNGHFLPSLSSPATE